MEKVDLLGKVWFVEYCYRWYSQKQRRELYEYYVTDAVKQVNQNLASFVGGEVFSKRFYDLVNEPPTPSRTADEIINDISSKLEGMSDESI